jgi:hypothetical protein
MHFVLVMMEGRRAKGGRRRKGAKLILLYETMEAEPAWPNHILKVLSLNTDSDRVAIKFQDEFGGTFKPQHVAFDR